MPPLSVSGILGARIMKDTDSPAPPRRLSDLLLALDFCEVQLGVLLRTGRAHHTRNLSLRLASLHHRIDDLERLIRLRSLEFAEDASLPIHQLRKRLMRLDRRHSMREQGRPGQERRRQFRRRVDLVEDSPAREQHTL
jgi:hypothetical protein